MAAISTPPGKKAIELARTVSRLDPDDRKYILDLAGAYRARAAGLATPEQLALIENSRRELAAARKGN